VATRHPYVVGREPRHRELAASGATQRQRRRINRRLTSRLHTTTMEISYRDFAWRRVVDLLSCQNSELGECASGEVGGACGVAGAAADDEATSGAAARCHFLDVVGGEVGGGVGGLLGPAGAPVAEEGAMVGDDAASAFAFAGVVVEVGASCCLGSVQAGLAVSASSLAAYLPAASEAGAEQGPSHRRLRLRRWTNLSRHLGQRSPGPTNWLLQAQQRPPRPWKRFCLFLRTAEEGEEGGHVLGPAGRFPDAGDSSAGVGGDPDDSYVVEQGLGPGDPLLIS
jgi:hypothetical protein